jgi:hypothetical protein
MRSSSRHGHFPRCANSLRKDRFFDSGFNLPWAQDGARITGLEVGASYFLSVVLLDGTGSAVRPGPRSPRSTTQSSGCPADAQRIVAIGSASPYPTPTRRNARQSSRS